MTSNHIEIEVKSLLGNKENADKLLEKVKENYPTFKLLHEEKQLNHYFKLGDFISLSEKIVDNLSDDQKKQFKEIIEHGKNHSVRTRWIHNKP
jgi:hypothetical protein